MKFLHAILYSGVVIRKYIMNLESVFVSGGGGGGTSRPPASSSISSRLLLEASGCPRELLLLLSLTHVHHLAFAQAFKISDCLY